MFDPALYRDLLVICADMDGQVEGATEITWRSYAHFLLAGEQAARLRGTTRNWNRPNNQHPAFIANAEGAERRGGPNIARYFAFHENGVWGVSTPREPATGYEATLSTAALLGGIISAFVRSIMGNDWVDAERRHLRRGGVAPNGEYVLDPIVDRLTAPEITLSAGTWRVQFAGKGWSRDDTDPTTVSWSLALDGTPVATNAISRDSGDVTEFVTFSTEDDIVVASPAVLTLVNGGSAEQQLHGILRFWEL